MKLSQDECKEIVLKCIWIRQFEKKLLHLFSQGKLRGTTHTCYGQELTPVIYSRYINDHDFVFSNHRGHGHYLAHKKNEEALLDELQGLKTGISGGIGGSQHIRDGRYFSNGILCGMLPIALGSSIQASKTNNVSMIYLGDGATSEGLFHEVLNICGLIEAPLLIVIEVNNIAQSTDINDFMSGNMRQRIESYGLEVHEFKGHNINDYCERIKIAIERLRSDKKTQVHMHYVNRLSAHSKGDDTRDEKKMKDMVENDYLKRYCDKFQIKIEALDTGKLIQSNKEERELKQNEARLENSNNQTLLQKPNEKYQEYWVQNKQSYSHSINKSLNLIFEAYNDALIIGEDINDPYGGAFKITKGIQSKYPEKVYSSPISEAAITGISIGYGLEGAMSICEIMFGDFITLCADQIINHAIKFAKMYGNPVGNLIILRTPMGGYRGYGPTHSQCLEKIFMGFEDLFIIAFNRMYNPLKAYEAAYARKGTYIFLENKIDYSLPSITESVLEEEGFDCTIYIENGFPIFDLQYAASIETEDCLIICYGGMLEKALVAVKELFCEHEISSRVICPTELNPKSSYLTSSIQKSNSKVICFVQESYAGAGFFESLITENMVGNKGSLNNKILEIVSCRSSVIACSKSAEDMNLPTSDAIVNKIYNHF